MIIFSYSHDDYFVDNRYENSIFYYIEDISREKGIKMSKKMESVSNKIKDEQYQVMFDKLKKEILIGHQDINQGKVSALYKIRKVLNFNEN